MAKKKWITTLNFRLPVAEAKNDSIVGPTFGQYGIKGMDFCKKFNEFSSQQNLSFGLILKVLVTIYKDRSFTFILKTPPLFFLASLIEFDNNINLRDIYKLAFIKMKDSPNLDILVIFRNILFSLKKYKYLILP